MLAILIGPDDRKRKPYALPGQNVPYTSLNQQQIRSLVTKVAVTMKNRGMHVTGKYYIHVIMYKWTADLIPLQISW